ncbi:MAG: 50S ribosome-binding GTPase [Planctomycetia bacterium]|nr:50S ribosome-binding GTPase [Planctomycetia bacterium]
MNEFTLKTISDSVTVLLQKGKTLLKGSPLEEIRQLAQQVPDSVLESEDEKISVVFAGQYSAGKSSLIRILTGREDIAVGAKITTDTATSYDWNGITIIDTPGIHTSLHPDHDARSYTAISRADLLIFVITNELMDSYILHHFKKLAIENGKGFEMMLVINKMERDALGNVESVRNIKLADLRAHIAPLIPENLYLSFVDADSYNKAMKEGIEKRRVKRLERSNMDSFIENLNRFVQDKGLVARYTTSLYALEQILEEAISIAFRNISNENIDIQSLESILVQNRKLLENTRQEILRGGKSKIELAKSSVIKKGSDILANVEDTKGVQDTNWIISIVQNLQKELDCLIARDIRNFEEQIEKKLKSTYASTVFEQVMPRLKKLGVSTDMIGRVKMMQSICGAAQIGSRTISGANTAISWLSTPQENMPNSSITDGAPLATDTIDSGFDAMDVLSAVGPILMTAKGVFDLISIWLEEERMREHKERLAEARNNVQNQFCQIAYSLEDEFQQHLNDYINRNLDHELIRLSHHLDELRSTQECKADEIDALRALRNATSQKIQEIQAGQETTCPKE